MHDQQAAHATECGECTESMGSQSGQALAEYAIILMTVSIVAIIILASIGVTVSSLYERGHTSILNGVI
jgi:Flp pilus assembly pilin Flp